MTEEENPISTARFVLETIICIMVGCIAVYIIIGRNNQKIPCAIVVSVIGVILGISICKIYEKANEYNENDQE